MMVLWEKRLTDVKGKFKPLRMWSLNKGRRGMSTRTKQQPFFHVVKEWYRDCSPHGGCDNYNGRCSKHDFLPPAQSKWRQKIP